MAEQSCHVIAMLFFSYNKCVNSRLVPLFAHSINYGQFYNDMSVMQLLGMLMANQ